MTKNLLKHRVNSAKRSILQWFIMAEFMVFTDGKYSPNTIYALGTVLTVDW